MAIAIIDYGMGNLTSVRNALTHVGADVVVTSEPAALHKADGIVLPGVGAFGEGMAHLRALGLDTVLSEQVANSGKPLLGICLGMQLLFEQSSEHGDHAGLGLVPGQVRRLAPPEQTPPLRVPHVGWNHVDAVRTEGLFRTLPEQEAFYFVHSYVCVPTQASDIAGWSEHGERFACALETGPIWAAQFHPEKSHKAGLTLLKNWLEFVARC